MNHLETFFPIILILFLLYLVFKTVIFIHDRFIYPIKQFFKKKNEHGYILTSQGNFEHRFIVEKLIKRKLEHGEEVHHINGIKWDNRKKNLALMSREEHLRWHQKLEWMWSKRYKTPLNWQKKQLKSEFGAKLFS